jgi:hypothetical protein
METGAAGPKRGRGGGAGGTGAGYFQYWLMKASTSGMPPWKTR